MNTFIESAFTRKPLRLVRKQAHCSDETSRYNPVAIFDTETPIKPSAAAAAAHGGKRNAPLRHMSLLDLVFFGIGTTIGSGVFVLAGVVAHNYAGPSASLSYLIAGCVAALSGLPYAELSAAFPLDGSTYSYAYITLGEVFAVMASLCQTLEYGGASAAVARSWGSKFVDWLHEGRDESNPLPSGLDSFLTPGYSINPMGAIIALLCTIILLCGVQESKMTTNVVSATKVSLIVFMIVAGFLLASNVFPNSENTPASFSNWSPFVPPEMGASGIIDGSSILFFAFLGYDQICNLSGEAKNPVKDVPRAVVLTLMIDGVVYMLAALALTAMVPYADISTISAFPRAFGANGVAWAETLTAIGEIVTLPLVVLTGIQSQTRLFFAMSKDKLVPQFFGKLTFSHSRTCCVGEKKEDTIGNLSANVQFCGVVIVILALFVPFQYIESLISAGALFLFSLTDVCLLMIRYKCPSESFLGNVNEVDDSSIFSLATVREQLSLSRLLILLNVFSFASGLCFAFIPIAAVKYTLAAFFAVLTFCVTLYIACYCPQATSTRFALEKDDGYGKPKFRTPLVPYLPALGIFCNWFMVANVGWQGIVMLLVYLLLGVAIYGGFCSGKSLTCEYENSDSYTTSLLPGRTSPTSSINSPLQETLLPGGEWEDDEAKRDLSEIETSKSVRFV